MYMYMYIYVYKIRICSYIQVYMNVCMLCVCVCSPIYVCTHIMPFPFDLFPRPLGSTFPFFQLPLTPRIPTSTLVCTHMYMYLFVSNTRVFICM